MKSGNIYGKGPRGKATKLHAEVVRSRGRCEKCGSVDNLQCAHIIPRRFAATRTDERAAWCLCARCHMRLTEHADEHMVFVAQTVGIDAFHVLKDRALAGVKTNDAFWQGEIERLTALRKEAA